MAPDPVSIYSPVGTESPYYAESGWLADDAAIVVPTKDTVWKKISGGDVLTPKSPVTLEWENGQGLVFERKLEVDDDYLFTITQTVENKGTKPVTLYAYSSITHKGIPKHSTTVGYEGPVGYVGQDLHQINYSNLLKEKDNNQSFDGQNGWIGISEKYWLTSCHSGPERTTYLPFRERSRRNLKKRRCSKLIQEDWRKRLKLELRMKRSLIYSLARKNLKRSTCIATSLA